MRNKYIGRNLLKTITWRIIATFTTMMIVYVFTKKVTLSIEVGIVEVSLKMLFYYFHEIGWDRISWGKYKHPLQDLVIKKEIRPEDMIIIEKKLKDLGYL